MKIHPLLQDPNAVLVFQTSLSERVHWEDYRTAAMQVMAAMQVELEDEKAVIKPNVTSGEHFANPDLGITTHPGFVEGMALYLQKHGVRRKAVTIVEDPRNSDDNTPRHWLGTGYERVAQTTGARLHSPSTYTCVRKPVPHPLAHRLLNVSRLAIAPNTILFNVPKLKTHNLAITTLCMKNLMGLVSVFERHYCLQAWQAFPEPDRSNQRPRHEWMSQELHEQWQTGLAHRLVDTAQIIQPALNIVEGIIGREGTGFQRGRNRALGIMVAGVNMVAVDSLASYLMGFDPLRLIYLQVAAEAGLGVNDIPRLKVYTPQAGELIACSDVPALRFDPPFRVISNVMGEDADPFHSNTRDASDLLWITGKTN